MTRVKRLKDNIFVISTILDRTMKDWCASVVDLFAATFKLSTATVKMCLVPFLIIFAVISTLFEREGRNEIS